jgi:orotate phosphoribosyltransferase
MNRVIEILKQTGAVLDNSHFVGTQGRHFDLYINKDALLPHTESVSEICKIFAEKYKDTDIDVVVAPALGGIFLSQWTAYHLTKLKGKEILSLYTEKTPDGGQIFTRGNDVRVKGKKVLLLEDTVTTGGSVVKTANSVKAAGGEIVAVCVMINKDPENINAVNLVIPIEWLSELPVTTYAPEECPLCKAGVPINTTVGHGKKFLEATKNK